MSPTILREGPYRFFFSREESRPHIHVVCGDGEAKFWIEPIVALSEYAGLGAAQLGSIQSIVERHRDEFRIAWVNTSAPESAATLEVVNISAHGFWLFDERSRREYFLPYAEFPWFADATVAQIAHVERQGVGTLHWPDLDVDLDFERIRHPERFPLRAR